MLPPFRINPVSPEVEALLKEYLDMSKFKKTIFLIKKAPSQFETCTYLTLTYAMEDSTKIRTDLIRDNYQGSATIVHAQTSDANINDIYGQLLQRFEHIGGRPAGFSIPNSEYSAMLEALDTLLAPPTVRSLDLTAERTPNMSHLNFKKEATDAGYRVVATQTVRLTQATISAALSKLGPAEFIAELLDSEYGRAMISMALGIGIEYLPEKSEKITRIGKEYRIGAMTTAGNEIASMLTDTIMGVLLATNEEEVRSEEKKDTLSYPIEVVEDLSELNLKTA